MLNEQKNLEDVETVETVENVAAEESTPFNEVFHSMEASEETRKALLNMMSGNKE